MSHLEYAPAPDVQRRKVFPEYHFATKRALYVTNNALENVYTRYAPDAPDAPVISKLFSTAKSVTGGRVKCNDDPGE